MTEYTQVTSPLRRYSDLAAHQQIRAFLSGAAPLGMEEVLERIAAGEAAAQATVHAERASRQHWTMVLLSRMKGSEWDAVVVERKGPRAIVLIPDLALETLLNAGSDAKPNDAIRVAVSAVSIPDLEARFAPVRA